LATLHKTNENATIKRTDYYFTSAHFIGEL